MTLYIDSRHYQVESEIVLRDDLPSGWRSGETPISVHHHH